MNPRLTKELRPLLLPWALAATAAVGHLLARPGSAFFHGEFGDFIAGLAGLAFVLGVLVLAAMPVGAELHNRTLTLLLSQPMERARLWKEKLLAASLMITALAIVHGLATVVMGRLNLTFALLYLAFAVTAICSVGYHTLATRSVLVGIASAVGLPYGLTLSAYLIVRYLLGIELQLSDQAALTLVLSACAAYAALSLWLSRRQFVSLELKDAGVSRAAEVPAALVPRKLSDLFRPRPTGVTLNLIRKEICLHKPIFLVSAIFTAAWLLTLLVMLLRPEWRDYCVGTLNGLTAMQVVLMIILGGCTALGDDKALGTTMWHLSLPVSARRQWFIKLITAAVTFVVVAIILPTLLATPLLLEGRVGLLAIRPGDVWGMAMPCAVVFVLSFWSASLASSTVRAALTCVLALIGLGGCLSLGKAATSSYGPSSLYVGLQSGFITRIVAYNQLSPNYFVEHSGLLAYSVVLTCLVFMTIALMQSLRLFRRLQIKPAVKVKYAIVLAMVALGGSFWCADLMRSVQSGGWRLASELREADLRLWQNKGGFPVNDGGIITVAELEQTGALSETGKTWLKNSRITYTSSPSSSPKRTAVQILVTFPNGNSFSFESHPPPLGENKP
ncbi:MAG: hypothetical protein U1F83_18535 [Verrucomicrobiota bacterium]